MDALKGYLAVFGGGVYLPSRAIGTGVGPGDWSALLAGVAAIVGHNYPCWLRFRGGKGIATSAGVLLAVMPAALGICLVVWVGVFVVSRYVSLASIAAALALPLAVWFTGRVPVLTLVGLGLGALAIYRHRANLRRLWNGTEPRWTRTKPTSPHPA